MLVSLGIIESKIANEPANFTSRSAAVAVASPTSPKLRILVYQNWDIYAWVIFINQSNHNSSTDDVTGMRHVA